MISAFRFARRAGFVCLAGGVLQMIYGLLAVRYPYGPDIYHGWDEALWLAAGAGMIGAVTGLLLLDLGRPRWLALGSGALAILGLVVRAAASVLIVFRTASAPAAIIPLTVLVILLSMLVLGIAVLRGKELDGWRAWTPLLVSITGFFVAAIFSIDLNVHFILLGLWGIPWMLVGFVIIQYVSKREEAKAPREVRHRV